MVSVVRYQISHQFINKYIYINSYLIFINRYSAIKKKCFGDYAVPSQVATKFNLEKDKGYDSIVTKIVIQMCAKLGKIFFLSIVFLLAKFLDKFLK